MALINGSYYDSILGESPESFINIFKRSWNSHLESFPKKYVSGEQLIIGERFRPVILCWGYILTGNEFNKKKKEELSKLALHIELLHKATLLIDDLIDNDSARHGKKTFHIQYSNNEAILFAIYLLGDSLESLVDSLKELHFEQSFSDIISLFSRTIKEMTLGALQEVNLDSSEYLSNKLIKEIIENQTISIIKNGLLTGYKFGNGSLELNNTIDKIGYDCGYIFQLLNDLEPFGSESINISHKGRNNIDILSSRKNLIVPFIYNSLKAKDKIVFKELICENIIDEQLFLSKVHCYFNDNRVLDLILVNLVDVRFNIDRNLAILEKKLENVQLVNDFRSFLFFIFMKAIERVGTSYHNKLSEILIK